MYNLYTSINIDKYHSHITLNIHCKWLQSEGCQFAVIENTRKLLELKFISHSRPMFIATK